MNHEEVIEWAILTVSAFMLAVLAVNFAVWLLTHRCI